MLPFRIDTFKVRYLPILSDVVLSIFNSLAMQHNSQMYVQIKCCRLNSIDEHVKNYAPQILALSGAPGARPALLHLANLITKNHSLLISGEIHPVRSLNKWI